MYMYVPTIPELGHTEGDVSMGKDKLIDWWTNRSYKEVVARVRLTD